MQPGRHLPVPVRRDAYDDGLGWKFDSLKKSTYVNFVRAGYGRVRAAELVGVSYHTVRRHLDLDGAFADAVSIAEMAKVDEVEESLFETAIAGNFHAQKFVLVNRRGERWRDFKVRNEAALREADEEELEDQRERGELVSNLKDRLLEIRDRLTPAAADTAEAEDDDHSDG